MEDWVKRMYEEGETHMKQILEENNKIRKRSEEKKNELIFDKMMKDCGIYKYPRFYLDK